MRVAVCTVAARNYLALVRSLFASVAEFEPACDRYAFVIDDVDGVETLAEGAVVRPASVFAPEAYATLVRGYDVTELATAVKPSFLQYLLDRGYDRVLYLDPDIQVFAPLDPVLDPLAAHDIVLTPHIVDAAPVDGQLRGELTLLRTGVFNLGCIGIANTPNARDVLAWWAGRLDAFCRNDVRSGLFFDQRWMDLVPGIFERICVVRHRGCNVAYWNLDARPLSEGDELRLRSGEPVVFFHFSGFDPRRPERLCAHPVRTRVSEHPRLRALLAAYAARVIERGHLERLKIPYAFGRPLKARVRALGRRMLGQRVDRRYSA